LNIRAISNGKKNYIALYFFLIVSPKPLKPMNVYLRNVYLPSIFLLAAISCFSQARPRGLDFEDETYSSVQKRQSLPGRSTMFQLQLP
jgi:hypothetical protein